MRIVFGLTTISNSYSSLMPAKREAGATGGYTPPPPPLPPLPAAAAAAAEEANGGPPRSATLSERGERRQSSRSVLKILKRKSEVRRKVLMKQVGKFVPEHSVSVIDL